MFENPKNSKFVRDFRLKMDLRATGLVSNLHSSRPTHLERKHIQSLLCCKSQLSFTLKEASLSSGLRYYNNSFSRSAIRERSPTDSTPYDGKPEREGLIRMKIDQNKEDGDTQLNEVHQGGSLFDNSVQLFKFLDNFDIKVQFDSEETYPVLVISGGGAITLWLAASVVGAIDSIPVFPKVIELVGLAYTIWFSSRYLIFKENRDELIARAEKLKEEVLGSKDD